MSALDVTGVLFDLHRVAREEARSFGRSALVITINRDGMDGLPIGMIEAALRAKVRAAIARGQRDAIFDQHDVVGR